MKFIASADWHLRSRTPLSRTGDFRAQQENKVRQVYALAEKHACAAILVSGDLGDRPVEPMEHILWELGLLRESPCPIVTIAGNHDLPGMNYQFADRSLYGLLRQVGVIIDVADAPMWLDCAIYGGKRSVALFGVPWGKDPASAADCDVSPDDFAILLLHEMVLPMAGGIFEGTAIRELSQRHKNWDLVLTGHNHARMYSPAWKGGCAVLNPGPILRQTAAAIDQGPVVYLVDTDTRELTALPLQYERDAVSTRHILQQAVRDSRAAEFVDGLECAALDSLDFRANLKKILEENKASALTLEMCNLAIEGAGYESGTGTGKD